MILAIDGPILQQSLLYGGTFAIAVSGGTGIAQAFGIRNAREESVQRFAVIGMLLVAAHLTVGAVATGSSPTGSFPEAMAIVSVVVAGAYLFLGAGMKIPALGGFLLPLAFVFAAGACAGAGPTWEGVTPWGAMHGATALLGFGAFAVAFGTGGMYLLADAQLKRPSGGTLRRRMPSIESLDRLNHRAVVIGFPFFSLSLLLGIAGAADRGDRDWYANPLVLVELMVWGLYALLIYLRTASVVRGRRAAWMVVLGFLLCMAGFIGVTLSGGHG